MGPVQAERPVHREDLDIPSKRRQPSAGGSVRDERQLGPRSSEVLFEDLGIPSKRRDPSIAKTWTSRPSAESRRLGAPFVMSASLDQGRRRSFFEDLGIPSKRRDP